MRVGEYLEVIGLAHKRFRSDQDYANFQMFQCRQIISYLSKKSIILEGKKILDIGCGGEAGYSVELAKKAGELFCLDLEPVNIIAPELNFVQGDALNLPFRDNSFDFVFCASLIEHVENPRRLISEIHRVMKDESYCYLSFPPFYSFFGGHQFKPYHLLPEKIAFPLIRWIKKIDVYSYNDSGLYKCGIKQVQGYIEKEGFRIKDVSTRYSPVNFARVPLFKDLFTWHVQFILKK